MVVLVWWDYLRYGCTVVMIYFISRFVFVILTTWTPHIMVSTTLVLILILTNVVGFTWSYGYFLNTPDLGLSHWHNGLLCWFPIGTCFAVLWNKFLLLRIIFISSTEMWLWLGRDIICSLVVGLRFYKIWVTLELVIHSFKHHTAIHILWCVQFCP